MNLQMEWNVAGIECDRGNLGWRGNNNNFLRAHGKKVTNSEWNKKKVANHAKMKREKEKKKERPKNEHTKWRNVVYLFGCISTIIIIIELPGINGVCRKNVTKPRNKQPFYQPYVLCIYIYFVCGSCHIFVVLCFFFTLWFLASLKFPYCKSFHRSIRSCVQIFGYILLGDFMVL